MAGKDGEMFMTRSFSLTPKTTEQHLIARSDKSVAYVTDNKRLCSTFCTIEADYWLKRPRDASCLLVTDRHETSRGLFATAEQLLVSMGHTWLLWLWIAQQCGYDSQRVIRRIVAYAFRDIGL